MSLLAKAKARARAATAPDTRWEPLEVSGELFAETGTRTDSVHKGHCVVTLRGLGGRFVIGEANLETAARLAALVGRQVRARGRAHWARQDDGQWRQVAFEIDTIDALEAPGPAGAARG